ncbi:hypothetical protein HA402_009891 [Bradysia odoriphaga]|nr:hypothetical protein HA402_009891 [Bradysia odoriphaga]
MEESSRNYVRSLVERVNQDPDTSLEIPSTNICTDATLRCLIQMADTVSKDAKREYLLFTMRIGDEFRLSTYLRAMARIKVAEAGIVDKSMQRAYLREAVRISQDPIFAKKLDDFDNNFKPRPRRLAASLKQNICIVYIVHKGFFLLFFKLDNQ